MPQSTLFDRYNPPAFSGSTFDEALDGERLTTQLDRVRTAMRDGQWRTLSEIHALTKDPEASISARLRQLKAKGRRRGDQKRGLWEYQLAAAESEL